MNSAELKQRRANLIAGLKSLENKVVEYTRAIEIQKGALGECDYWIEVLENKEKESSQEENK